MVGILYSFFLFVGLSADPVGNFGASRKFLGAEGALFSFEMKSRKSGAPKAPQKGK